MASFASESPAVTEHPSDRPVSIQFFGDFYLPQHVLEKTGTTLENFSLLANVLPLLNEATINVVNLEGVATRVKYVDLTKKYSLKMPLDIASYLARSHIHLATLANNHSMDFGYQGLFETISGLERLHIKYAGAGANLEEALRPARFPTTAGDLCFIALNRTFPEAFAATPDHAGVAALNFAQTKIMIKKSRIDCSMVFVIFHWGTEHQDLPNPYQIHLAHLAINAGADAVIGHHPHVLQPIEFYKGSPIFYSLGNFIFSTKPFARRQEGLVARLLVNSKNSLERVDLIPLNVQNSKRNYVPDLVRVQDQDPLSYLKQQGDCTKLQKEWVHWRCLLSSK